MLYNDVKDSLVTVEAENNRIRQSIATEIQRLEKLRDQAYTDKLEGVLGDDDFQRRDTEWCREIAELKTKISLLENPFRLLRGVRDALELTTNVCDRYTSMNFTEKSVFLTAVLRNSTYYRKNIYPVYVKPFDILSGMEKESEWRGQRDAFRTFWLAMIGVDD